MNRIWTEQRACDGLYKKVGEMGRRSIFVVVGTTATPNLKKKKNITGEASSSVPLGDVSLLQNHDGDGIKKAQGCELRPRICVVGRKKWSF